MDNQKGDFPQEKTKKLMDELINYSYMEASKDAEETVVTVEEYDKDGKLLKKTTTRPKCGCKYPDFYPFYKSYYPHYTYPWYTIKWNGIGTASNY